MRGKLVRLLQKVPIQLLPKKLNYPGARVCGSISVLRKAIKVEYRTCSKECEMGEAESEGRVTPVSRYPPATPCAVPRNDGICNCIRRAVCTPTHPNPHDTHDQLREQALC